MLRGRCCGFPGRRRPSTVGSPVVATDLWAGSRCHHRRLAADQPDRGPAKLLDAGIGARCAKSSGQPGAERLAHSHAPGICRREPTSQPPPGIKSGFGISTYLRHTPREPLRQLRHDLASPPRGRVRGCENRAWWTDAAHACTLRASLRLGRHIAEELSDHIVFLVGHGRDGKPWPSTTNADIWSPPDWDFGLNHIALQRQQLDREEEPYTLCQLHLDPRAGRGVIQDGAQLVPADLVL